MAKACPSVVLAHDGPDPVGLSNDIILCEIDRHDLTQSVVENADDDELFRVVIAQGIKPLSNVKTQDLIHELRCQEPGNVTVEGHHTSTKKRARSHPCQ